MDASKFPFLDRVDVADGFFTNKLAPVPRIIYDWMRGEKAYKDEDYNFIKDKIAPMWISDVMDAWKDDEAYALITVFPWTIIGGGVQTYGKPIPPQPVSPAPKVWLPEDADRAIGRRKVVRLLQLLEKDTTLTPEQKKKLGRRIIQDYEGENNAR